MNNIVYTKVKFVRNLKNCNFESNIYDRQQVDILNLCMDAINSCGLKSVKLSELGNNVVDNLLARELLERDFVYECFNKGYANKDNTTIQINSRNHIEIFAIENNIFEAYSMAKEIDKKLCNKLNFAYSDKYGFLTPDIKNIGSGMSVEIKVMLPALAKIGALDKLPNVNDKLGFDIKCLDRKSGLCVIITRATLGYTEKQICELSKTYIDKLLQLEVETSKKLSSESDDIDDNARRAKAILKNCLKITAVETYVLIGDILISMNAEIEKDITFEQVGNVLKIINLYEKDFNRLAKEIQKILD